MNNVRYIIFLINTSNSCSIVMIFKAFIDLIAEQANSVI